MIESFIWNIQIHFILVFTDWQDDECYDKRKIGVTSGVFMWKPKAGPKVWDRCDRGDSRKADGPQQIKEEWKITSLIEL